MNNQRIAERIILILFVILISLPLVTMFLWAFFETWGADNPFPSRFTMGGFRYFFTRDLPTALKSVAFSMAVSFLTLCVCILTAKGLYELCAAAVKKRTVEAIMYLPMILPVVSICMGVHKLFLRLGITGSAAVFLMHGYFAFPYIFQIVYALFTSWGTEYEKTAMNLGCGHLRSFFSVHLPIYLPGYRNAFFMGFIISYSQYFINFYLGGWEDINFAMIMSPYVTSSNRNLSNVYTLMYLLFGGVVLILTNFIKRSRKEAAIAENPD